MDASLPSHLPSEHIARVTTSSRGADDGHRGASELFNRSPPPPPPPLCCASTSKCLSGQFSKSVSGREEEGEIPRPRKNIQVQRWREDEMVGGGITRLWTHNIKLAIFMVCFIKKCLKNPNNFQKTAVGRVQLDGRRHPNISLFSHYTRLLRHFQKSGSKVGGDQEAQLCRGPGAPPPFPDAPTLPPLRSVLS